MILAAGILMTCLIPGTVGTVLGIIWIVLGAISLVATLDDGI